MKSSRESGNKYRPNAARKPTDNDGKKRESLITRGKHIKHNTSSARNYHCTKEWNPALVDQILDAVVTPHQEHAYRGGENSEYDTNERNGSIDDVDEYGGNDTKKAECDQVSEARCYGGRNIIWVTPISSTYDNKQTHEGTEDNA